MEISDRIDFEALATYRDDVCLSLYMPTVKAGAETQENPIRLKNLVAEAESKLAADTAIRLPDHKADNLLQPARELIDDHEFWAHQNQGLAIFLASDDFRVFKLPIEVAEEAVVKGRYYLKPLLTLLSGDQPFYLLALSQDQLRVFKGDRYEMTEITPEAMPNSLSEALKWDDPEQHLDWHTQTETPGGEGGARDAIYHGGGLEDLQKERIRQYFHQVDRGMQELLAGADEPLLLAGVDYLLPIYQDANGYGHLLDEGIEGNPEEKSAAQLHEQAVAIMEPIFKKEQKEAWADFQRLAGTERVATELSEIVPAAHYGRVDVLFADQEAEKVGSFDEESGQIHVNGMQNQIEEVDLIYLAALQTYLNSGKVFVIESSQVPTLSATAAILRY